MIIKPALYNEKVPLNELLNIILVKRIFVDLVYNELCIIYMLVFYNQLMHNEIKLNLRLKFIELIKLTVYNISSQYAF